MRWMQKIEFDHTHHTMLGILLRGEYWLGPSELPI